MQIEYEATFPSIDKNKARKCLKKAGAKLIRSEYLQKRIAFDLPKGHEIKGGWLRVRDEGDKITMSLKVVDGDKIHNQKEICIEVNDFNNTAILLKTIGCEQKAFQESKRELWRLKDVEITIDEWPFLEPFIEIEGRSEKAVQEVSMLIGFDYTKALFCSVDTLYSKKYGVSKQIINKETPKILFNSENPFIKK